MKNEKNAEYNKNRKAGAKKITENSIQIKFAMDIRELNTMWCKQKKELFLIVIILAMLVIAMFADARVAAVVANIIDVVEKFTPLLKLLTILTGLLNRQPQ